MMIVDINGICLQKIYVNFLISTLKMVFVYKNIFLFLDINTKV